MRCLGEFVGHVWRGVKADPSAARAARIEVRRETAENEGVDEAGRRVVARRTVIDEIEVTPGSQARE
jgi:hypothetical protein